MAQAAQTIKLDNNKASSENIKPELQYLFSDFQPGSVVLKEGKVIKCMLNYNFLTDEMLFIDDNGKKMALANPHDVRTVYIAKRMFVSAPKGYYEVIEKGAVELVYKWNCNITEKGKAGALGIATDAPSVYQMNQISFDAKTWKLDVNKDAVVTVLVVPYLKVGSKYITIKGTRDYLKAYPGKKAEIKGYIEQNPVDFKKEADLRRLTIYCNSL